MADQLIPEAPGLRLESVTRTEHQFTVQVRTASPTAVCPICKQPSPRRHSRYSRTVADVPWSGFAVRLELHVRRFFCITTTCRRRIFTERLPTVVTAWGRRTGRQTELLRLVAFALGGEAGARLLRRLQMLASPTTLLRLIRRTPLVTSAQPRVVGVDDWAYRKGQRYGTILVDLERHRPLDLLDDRTAATLAARLQTAPDLEMVSRDRSTEYARGIELGAPQAVQVADRWHLVRNLRDVLERLIVRFPQVLELPAADAALLLPAPSRADPRRRAQRHQRSETVRALRAEGRSISSIARQLRLNRATVRRFLAAERFPEIPRRRPRPGMLTPYEPYLQRRWKEGCQNGLQLWREVQGQGYPGSRKLVARWVQQHRVTLAPTTPTKYRSRVTAVSEGATPTAPVRWRSPRQVAWLLLRRSADLTHEDQTLLARLGATSQPLQHAYSLAQRFVRMVRERTPDPLDDWLEAAEGSDLPELRTFAIGLRQDYSAIRAALSLEWSNGQVEGQITRLKLLKRQMYGRAKLDLLRQRLLWAA